MGLLFAVLLAFALAGDEAKDLGNGLMIDHLDAVIPSNLVSDLSYRAYGLRKKFSDPTEAAKQAFLDLKAQHEQRLKNGSADDKYIAEKALGFLNTLEVAKGTQDAVALKQKRANGEGLVFSFRGTSGLRDLIPDVQLALNMKKVGRLEEAKQFVNEVMKENPQIKDKDMDMYGHSLGGFIAEGVRSFHPGARAVVISPGTPRVSKGKVRSWAEFDATKERQALGGGTDSIMSRTLRLRKLGDPVATGQAHGPVRSVVFARDDEGLLNPVKNHQLGDMDSATYKKLAQSMVLSGVNEGSRLPSTEGADLSLFKRAKKALAGTRIGKWFGMNKDAEEFQTKSTAFDPKQRQNPPVQVLDRTPDGKACGFDNALGFDPCTKPVPLKRPMQQQAPVARSRSPDGTPCGFNDALGFDPCENMALPKVSKNALKLPRTAQKAADIQRRWDERKLKNAAKNGVKRSPDGSPCGFNDALGFDPCENMALPKVPKNTLKMPRSAEKAADIQKRWDERKAKNAAKNAGYKAQPSKKPRTADQAKQIQARWDARKQKNAGYKAQPSKKPRTADQAKQIQARWDARKQKNAGYKAQPSKKPRTADQAKQIQARWDARKQKNAGYKAQPSKKPRTADQAKQIQARWDARKQKNAGYKAQPSKKPRTADQAKQIQARWDARKQKARKY